MSRRALVMLLLLASTAHAADSRRDKAAKLYTQGEQLFQAGQLEQAVVRFHEAYDALPRAELLLNIAQCYRGLGRPKQAIEWLERFLEDAPGHPLRPAAERTLASLRASEPAPTPPPSLVPMPTVEPAAQVAQPPVPPAQSPPKRWPWVVGIAAGVVAVGAAVTVGVVLGRPGPSLGTVTLPP